MGWKSSGQNIPTHGEVPDYTRKPTATIEEFQRVVPSFCFFLGSTGQAMGQQAAPNHSEHGVTLCANTLATARQTGLTRTVFFLCC